MNNTRRSSALLAVVPAWIEKIIKHSFTERSPGPTWAHLISIQDQTLLNVSLRQTLNHNKVRQSGVCGCIILQTIAVAQMSLSASCFTIVTPFQARSTPPKRRLPVRSTALFKRKQKEEPVVEEKPKKGGIFGKKQKGPRSKREAELLAELEKSVLRF